MVMRIKNRLVIIGAEHFMENIYIYIFFYLQDIIEVVALKL